MKIVTMYRPCGQSEMDLVAESGFKRWPPRLPEQPIFYPVTNLEYAEEVNNWNVRQFGKGYVTKFNVNKSFVDKYPIETVGSSKHTEWWIPAEDLSELNSNIVGLIEVVSERNASQNIAAHTRRQSRPLHTHGSRQPRSRS